MERSKMWASGYCSVLLCNKIEKCKDDADVDEIFFVAAFFFVFMFGVS